MAGILNSKQRIMDVIITKNGRRQIVNGAFEVKFVSFSDQGVFYREDSAKVADDASSRIMFESLSRPSDTIIPEIDAYGNMSVEAVGTQKITNGSVYNISGSIVSGSINIYSSSLGIMSQSLKHFDYLQMIGNKNIIFENKTFEIPNPKAVFSINTKATTPITNIDDIPPFITDPRFSNNITFAYLPPVSKIDDNLIPLGMYNRISEFPKTTISQIKKNLKNSGHQARSFEFKSNDEDEIFNLLVQVMENNKDEIKKLAMIDYGVFYDNNENKYAVYHVGKIVKDQSGRSKFFKIFTLIFE